MEFWGSNFLWWSYNLLKVLSGERIRSADPARGFARRTWRKVTNLTLRFLDHRIFPRMPVVTADACNVLKGVWFQNWVESRCGRFHAELRRGWFGSETRQRPHTETYQRMFMMRRFLSVAERSSGNVWRKLEPSPHVHVIQALVMWPHGCIRGEGVSPDLCQVKVRKGSSATSCAANLPLRSDQPRGNMRCADFVLFFSTTNINSWCWLSTDTEINRWRRKIQAGFRVTRWGDKN